MTVNKDKTKKTTKLIVASANATCANGREDVAGGRSPGGAAVAD